MTLPSTAGARLALLAAALLAVMLNIALFQALSGEQSSGSPAARSGFSPGWLSSLLPIADSALSTALDGEVPAYSVTHRGSGLWARNPAQRLDVRFGRSGMLLTSGDLRFGLSLRAVGYGASLEPVTPVMPRASLNRVSKAHVGIDEWYVNGQLGLEQGFTIPRELPGRPAGPLTLALATSGNARTAWGRNRNEISLSDARGRSLLYTGLTATDARGRTLRSWLELGTGELRVRVDVRGARYPLRIDPLIEQGPITVGGSGNVGFAFGSSVAVSSNGNIALVGGFGNVWVSTRSGSTWSEPEELSPAAGEADSSFGHSVALSSAGNVALVGGPENNEGVGAVWVFRRSGSTWREQEKIPGGAEIGEIGKGGFGASLAMSADGNIALVGGPGERSERGAAWIFTPLTPGTHFHRMLNPEAECVGDFGASVALSSDGARALVGCPAGTVLEFVRVGESRWDYFDKVQEGREKLGQGIAISGSGNSLLASGGISEYTTDGIGVLFTRSFSPIPSFEWGSPKELLVGSEAESCHYCPFRGGPVALSSDGGTAVIGAGSDRVGAGAAWVFRLTGSGSIQQGPRIVGGTEHELGASVAVSANGNTVLVGEPGFEQEHFRPGDVRVLVNPPPSVTTNGAANIGISTATLNAIADPNERDTTAYFQYGTTETYGQATPGESVAATSRITPLTSAINTLLPTTTYHFRPVAESSAGTSYGADQTFTTLPLPPPPLTPVNTGSPITSGAAIRGQALSASQGLWANNPTSFAYQWQSCDTSGKNCANLVGATGAAHILRQADVGHRLAAVVTAANVAGSGTATSATSAIVGSIVEASMTWGFGFARRFTIVNSLIVHELPAGGSVQLRCNGRGCPFAHARAARASHHRCYKRRCQRHPRRTPPDVSLTSLFNGSHLGVGTRILVNVGKPGWVGKSFLFTMRTNRAPRVQVACLAPGASQPGEGC